MKIRYAGIQTREIEGGRMHKGSFSSYMAHREHRLVTRIVSKLFPQPIPRYLDFACGTGRILSQLEKKARTSFGMDLSPSMLVEAKKRCSQSQFLCCDVTSDPLPEVEPFHLITAFRFFGRARDQIRKSVFVQLNKLLVDGGYLIFNNHRNPWSAISLVKRTGRYLDSGADFSYRKIRNYLSESNFKIERIYGIGIWFLAPGMNKRELCNSSLIRRIEPVSEIPFLAPFCPDTIIVARKSRK